MKRILYLSTHRFEDIGAFSGTNRRIFDALTELDTYEVDYYQASPNRFIRFLVRSIGRVSRVFFHKEFQTGLEERYYPSICRRTLCHLKKHKYDAIVCWQICFGGVFERFNGKKVFFADSTYHKIVPYYGWNVSHKQFKRVDESQRKLLLCSNQFWCFSSFFIEDAKKYYGLPDYRIRSFLFFPTIIERSKKSTSSGALKLLLVGTNYIDKGVPIALETVRILNENKGVSAHIDVVGVSETGDDSSRYATFHGRVSQFAEPERFAEFFANADVYFMPTLHECAGIVFAEAASYGIPSVSYQTGGVPDYVSDGISGFVLPEGSSAEAFAELIATKLATKQQRDKISKTTLGFFTENLSRSVFKNRASKCLTDLFEEDED